MYLCEILDVCFHHILIVKMNISSWELSTLHMVCAVEIKESLASPISWNNSEGFELQS